jgi:hypothetical protein
MAFNFFLDKSSSIMDEECIIRVASRIERAEHVSVAMKSLHYPVHFASKPSRGGNRYQSIL